MNQTAGPATQINDQLRFIEELKRQWMATIDALVDPLIIVDKNYDVLKTNQAMARHAEVSDVRFIIGKKCYEIFANRNTPCKGCKMQDAATQQQPQQYALNHVKEDRFFEATSQPIVDQKGGIEGVVQVYRDRTEAKRLQEQLFQTEKLASIGLLAGGVAHEINNPLGGILVFSQMLLREVPKESVHYQDIVEIEAAAQRCKKIVADLLEFARKDSSGQEDGVVSTFNAIDAAQSALRFARVSFKANTIEVKEDWGDGSFRVQGDRNRLTQVFLNLAQNAFQAMPDGGTVFLRSKRGRQGNVRTLIFEVEDTGTGIPKENLKKIFDPFFTTKEPGEGTGLGLAICHTIIKEMKGTLDVDSAPASGTIFRITLPDAEHTVKIV